MTTTSLSLATLPQWVGKELGVSRIGGSSMPRWPYRLSHLARVTDRLLTALGHVGQVDVLGVSWGGALAQQFARTCPQRCRRLILAATAAGVVMVPGKLGVISKLASPRRYWDPAYLNRLGGDNYGGDYRRDAQLLARHSSRILPPRGRGYMYQLLAGLGWTSILWLRSVRQPTLVMMGSDDPIVPVINGRILAALIPNARLRIVDDGHLFLLSRAHDVAPIIRAFVGAASA
ncbi:poly(3-hydroxyalkanoate) depolymerase [Variovorax sp. GT1P44]|uniref:poly(3-hydroxyalkanoate) depolymerase n=1 Tax=Variovorax sp. GT1P44 TaxID=3443742 RepID=UPI003F487453